LEEDPDGNVQHIAANGVTVEEYVEVFAANYQTAERQANLLRLDFHRKTYRCCLG
jgi:hypothetical protein